MDSWMGGLMDLAGQRFEELGSVFMRVKMGVGFSRIYSDIVG